MDVWAEVPAMSVIAIVEAVRTRVLKFILALEKQYPDVREIEILDEQKNKKDIRSIVKNTIYGNVGVFGNVSHSKFDIEIKSGDMQSLRSYFHQKGICEKDLDELQEALTLEPKLEGNGKFGKNVAAWIGK